MTPAPTTALLHMVAIPGWKFSTRHGRPVVRDELDGNLSYGFDRFPDSEAINAKALDLWAREFTFFQILRPIPAFYICTQQSYVMSPATPGDRSKEPGINLAPQSVYKSELSHEVDQGRGLSLVI